MYKKLLIALLICLVGLSCYQYIFGRNELFYSKKYNLFVYTKLYTDSIRMIKIGKSLLSIDNVITCYRVDSSPIFSFIILKDSVLLYDEGNNIISITEKSLNIKKIRYIPTDSVFIANKKIYISYAYEDSTNIKRFPYDIIIEANLSPAIYDREHKKIIHFTRLF